MHGIQPTPASAMTSTFYAASSVNVQPNPSQFQFHLPAQCEQSCHNTLGSYTCSCISGYQLAADGKSCLGKIDSTKISFETFCFWYILIVSLNRFFFVTSTIKITDRCVFDVQPKSLFVVWRVPVVLYFTKVTDQWALDTHTSECIFSILFYIHFLVCWQGEFV